MGGAGPTHGFMAYGHKTDDLRPQLYKTSLQSRDGHFVTINYQDP